MRGHDRREFGDQPHRGPIVVVLVPDVSARVEHAERRDGRLQGIHRMAVLGQALHQIDDAELDAAMGGDVGGEPAQLGLRGQSPEEQQEAGLKKGRSGAEIFEAHPAILQESPLSVDVAHRGSRRRNTGQAWHKIVGHRAPPPSPASAESHGREAMEERGAGVRRSLAASAQASAGFA